MKRKLAVLGVAALAASALTACGHDHSGTGMMPTPPPPTTPTNMMLTTSEVLSNYATKPSETGSPVAVNDSALTISDTSETTSPVGVNGN